MPHNPTPYDLLIIGGGINGASIARAAALAGQKVLLVEKDDLAQATSSASTKLMHGGLRYLEYFEFKLVGESLNERAIMLRNAPHLVKPLEFRLPHQPSMRAWPIVRIGLWLYDFLARKGTLPRSKLIRIDDAAMATEGMRGFSYWDGWVDDARLVIANALDAAENGADIHTQTQLISATQSDGLWTATLDTKTGQTPVSARMIVNASGPWVEQLLQNQLNVSSTNHTRLVRGSHLIVKRCFAGDHAYLLQQADGRVVFAIPYLDDFTLIGTTDIAVENPEDVTISPEEITYLLTAVNGYLRQPLTRDALIGHYAGIRPLVDDGTNSASAVTRDYRLELSTSGAPVLSIFGGKITTARHLAQEAIAKLAISGGSTHSRALPGGDFTDFAQLLSQIRSKYPFLDAKNAHRMARAYGTRLTEILGDATTPADLGQQFGASLCQVEVDYLIRHEWARSADDILMRRSKLAYQFTEAQFAILDHYVESKLDVSI